MLILTVLTVFFDGSAWKALIERRIDGYLSIASHVFGKEPTDYEAYCWWLASSSLLRFSTPTLSVDRHADLATSRKQKVSQAAVATRSGAISDEIRAAAQAERNRRCLAAKAMQKKQRLECAEEKRQKRLLKAKEKKKGH
jgi:hypothetical protein